jgi:hypothetical protein
VGTGLARAEGSRPRTLDEEAVADSGRFDHLEACARSPALAEPITTVITDALPRATEGSATRARSSHPALINIQRPDPLVSGTRRVDQRRQLRTMVVGLDSVPEAATDRRSPS